MSRQVIIDALRAARLSGAKLAHYPGPRPASMAEAFDLQSAVRTSIGWKLVGWKIGCTSERAQKALKADGPFPGPLYRERLFPSGTHVQTLPTNKPHHGTGGGLHHGPRSSTERQGLVRGRSPGRRGNRSSLN